MLKKSDVVLGVAILLLCVTALVIFPFIKPTGKTVIVSQNGAITHRLPLNQDFTLKLEHNTVTVYDGKAFMQSSDCENQICVKTPGINRDGEQIICLPNRVILEVSDSED